MRKAITSRAKPGMFKNLLMPLFLGLALSGSTQALTLKSHELNGAQLSDLSSAGLLALDLNFFSHSPVALEFELEAADVGQSVSFNSVLKAVGGVDFLQGLQVQLTGGALFSQIGSAYTPALLDLRTTALASVDGSFVQVIVTSLGQNEIYLGDPFVEGKSDWRIHFGNMKQGDRLVLSIAQVSAVPEPSTTLIMALGLMVLRLTRRATRNP